MNAPRWCASPSPRPDGVLTDGESALGRQTIIITDTTRGGLCTLAPPEISQTTRLHRTMSVPPHWARSRANFPYAASVRRVILSSPRSPAVPSRATSLLQSVLAKLVMVPENIDYHAGHRPCDCIVFALQAEHVLTRLPYPTFAERAHA